MLNIGNVVRETMFYISRLLLGYILHEIEKNPIINSLVWVIVLQRDMTGKHSQSSHTPPPPAQSHAFRNICGHFVVVVDVSMGGSSLGGAGWL